MPNRSNTTPFPSFLGILSLWIRLKTVKLGLQLFGFRRLYQLLYAKRKKTWSRLPPANRAQITAAQIAGQVCRINHDYLIVPANCLVESLTIWWLLRQQGFDADFRIGIRTITGRFESHAWVEYKEKVLNDIPEIGLIYEPMPLNDALFKQSLL